jgi:uncharacterized protein
MWSRLAEVRLRKLFSEFPAVLILGARQVGKTTLARLSFPDAEYADLQSPESRDLFTRDTLFQLERRRGRLLILDEAQAVPAVFSALRGAIDQERAVNGRFLILGSANPSLVRGVSESLAGRVGVLDLEPLTAGEAAAGSDGAPPHQVWLKGGFPDALRGDFREWWEAYLRTYVERDLPRLDLRPDALTLRRLLTMLAHQQGGLLNSSRLAESLGISHQTVRRYVGLLEQTFLVRVLPPYFRNVGKRLTKSPKVYLKDTGLLHHLLNIPSADVLRSHPVLGMSWETFVLEDIARRERIQNPHSGLFFWRTAAGLEADLVIDRGDERIVIEIKTGGGAGPRAAARLQAAADDVGASRSFMLTEAGGITPLAPGVERRGFSESLSWLP